MPDANSWILEETVEFRCYLSLAKIGVKLGNDYRGSDWSHDDDPYYEAHLEEVSGSDLDDIFTSQRVTNVYGEKRWAFVDPETWHGHDLHARVFRDKDHDVFYLVHRPTSNLLDWKNNFRTALIEDVPDKFKQAAQLIQQVRPEMRNRVIMSGYSLGGALAAFAALNAGWKVRTIAFDPLGLNAHMMREGGWSVLGQGQVLSERFPDAEEFIDWYYIAGSWVAKKNVELHLSSIGTVRELAPDPVRKMRHNLRNVRHGLKALWEEGWRGSVPALEVSGD
jgi:pimeloyl-ACP methyl ester carboxylesterase